MGLALSHNSQQKSDKNDNIDDANDQNKITSIGIKFKSKLGLAINFSSLILDDQPDTIHIDIINSIFLNDNLELIRSRLYSLQSQNISIYRDLIYKIITSHEFQQHTPDLFDNVIFHTRACNKLLVLTPKKQDRPLNGSGVDMCINITGLM